MRDLVVVGGGPAGLAAAIHAARAGLDVELWEPREGTIDKACGEGIQPAGVEALARLGVRPEGLPFVGIHYADAADATLFAHGTFPRGHGLGVRRTTLHAALREAAGAERIAFRAERMTALPRAGWIIGADGLASTVARAINDEISVGGRLGTRRHYRVAPWSDRVEVYFADGAEAYVTPVAPELVGVALLFAGRGHFDALLPRFPLLVERLGQSEPVTKTRGAGPFERRVRTKARGNVLLVGDAAGYVDPLTGEGVALGLQTAELAIDCILHGTPETYPARYRALTRTYFGLTRLLRFVAARRALHAPLLRGARLLPAAFDATLGLLAHGSMTRAANSSTW